MDSRPFDCAQGRPFAGMVKKLLDFSGEWFWCTEGFEGGWDSFRNWLMLNNGRKNRVFKLGQWLKCVKKMGNQPLNSYFCDYCG